MPGRLQKDFRVGNLAEHLGVLLLKGVAAVAEVSRPEDVGVDAVATLLRLADDSNYYAEDSFIVQLKARSRTLPRLTYTGHELKWLIGQSQPMFIGLVSLSDSRIDLYSTIHVNHATFAMHAEGVDLKFGISDIPPSLQGQKWCPWMTKDDGTAVVWLGDPILSWSLRDITQREWAQRAHSILKRFIFVARTELKLLECKQCSALNWSTNDLTSITSQWGMGKFGSGDYESLAIEARPFFRAMVALALVPDSGSSESLRGPLNTMASALRAMGIEIDPDNLIGLFLARNP